MVDFCESYSPFHVCLTIGPSAHLVYATSHLSFVTFYSYLVSWLAMCVHKMIGQMYGQTNMKRAIILAKINHPWNRYNMRMLRSWPTKIPNMNKIMFVWPYVRSHILCTHLVICLLSHFIHIWYLGWPWSYIIFHHSKRLLANCPGRIHISWFFHDLFLNLLSIYLACSSLKNFYGMHVFHVMFSL
jgi:hypothetical protein